MWNSEIRRSIVRIAIATAAFAAVVVLATWAFGFFGEMSAAGMAALALGIVFSLAAGVALMALVFYSSRTQDEAVYRAAAPPEAAGSKPDAERRDP